MSKGKLNTPMASGIAPKGTPKVAENTFVKDVKPPKRAGMHLAGGTHVDVKGTK